jgi:hypothetical protein
MTRFRTSSHLQEGFGTSSRSSTHQVAKPLIKQASRRLKAPLHYIFMGWRGGERKSAENGYPALSRQ